MIRSVGSSLPSFKALTFQSGLNVVLAERAEGSERTDTRNGLGKSSLLEIIHFVLGGGAEREHPFRQPPLDEYTFTVAFDLGDRVIAATRGGQDPQHVLVTDPDTGESERLPVAAWRARLGNEMFGLAQDAPKYSPSFGSLRVLLLRAR